jgi:hypothetical protein
MRLQGAKRTIEAAAFRDEQVWLDFFEARQSLNDFKDQSAQVQGFWIS